MSKLDFDFLNPKKHEYCNQLRHGTSENFAWLTSSNLVLRDFVKSADFPEFRLLSQSYSGALTTEILQSQGIGYVEFGSWFLTEPIKSWISSRKFSVSTCFILKSGATNEQCELFAEGNNEFFNHLWESPPETFPVDVISRFLRLLDAIAYIQQSDQLVLVSLAKLIDDFINSPSLIEIEENRRLKIIELRKNYIANCGPEVGPEKCLEDKCKKLRIELATRCLKHQFFAFNN